MRGHECACFWTQSISVPPPFDAGSRHYRPRRATTGSRAALGGSHSSSDASGHTDFTRAAASTPAATRTAVSLFSQGLGAWQVRRFEFLGGCCSDGSSPGPVFGPRDAAFARKRMGSTGRRPPRSESRLAASIGNVDRYALSERMRGSFMAAAAIGPSGLQPTVDNSPSKTRTATMCTRVMSACPAKNESVNVGYSWSRSSRSGKAAIASVGRHDRWLSPRSGIFFACVRHCCWAL